MRILVTGAEGFIAKNTIFFLKQRTDIQIFTFSRKNKISELSDLLSKTDFILHLAGVNRSEEKKEFVNSNETLTKELCNLIVKNKKKIPILFSSSTQVDLNNFYGISKKNAEQFLIDFSDKFKNPVYIFKLPNVFGKWCKPNYNSVVATFCYNIARNIPINVHRSADIIRLVYIDDVVNHFIKIIDDYKKKKNIRRSQDVKPSYQISISKLAKQIFTFKEISSSNILERVGTGLVRALYSTYVSYLPKEEFSYSIKQHIDQRGTFIEMLKTPDCGQFSCFTILPNKTRGNHYHHSKTEKFLVVKGRALFKFLNLNTLDTYEKIVDSGEPKIVNSIPGWAHSIKNIGDEEIIVMLWSNETYDSLRPDTYEYYKI